MKFKPRVFSGTLDPDISEREINHRELVRRAAAEGMVLLENDGILPLKTETPLAVYSGGALYTIKGGTGSGSVNNRQNVSIVEGLRNAGYVLTTEDWLEDYVSRYEKAVNEWQALVYANAEPGVFESLYKSYSEHRMEMPEGAPFTKTEADTALYVISRISGESTDRKDVKGDYYLSDTEEKDLKELAELYPHLIVILNVGGIMDLSFLDQIHVSALVLMSQAGMEGGNSLADILSGKVNPCGHLTDTWAYHYEDYPSSATFSHNNGNVIQEKYTDGIYVGYRYFDTFGIKPRYAFGFGRSYTSFAQHSRLLGLQEGRVIIETVITNTGSCAGKETTMIFVSCPQYGLRTKEKRRLTAFAKTGLLNPGESQTLHIEFSLELLETYHTGQSRYYFEQGNYLLSAGPSSDETVYFGALTLRDTVKLPKLTAICPLLDSLPEIKPSMERIAETEKERETAFAGLETIIPMDKEASLIGVHTVDRKAAENGRPLHGSTDSRLEETIEAVLKQMTESQKTQLCVGQVTQGSQEFIGSAAVHTPGAAGETSMACENLGIGEMILSDGPAGLRLLKRYEENPEDHSIYSMSRYEGLQNRFFGTEFLHENSIHHYQFCSAVPVGTLLAQTFDTELVKDIGELVGKEMKEFGVTLWLAPGMNIHRNPLCGRNFEYYSEDPLVSGMMGGSMTEGVQRHPGIGTTIKHFAANNQEDNRNGVSSIVSERALREIYLKGFEIAVRQFQPMAIMTSYNRLNSVHTANSYDLCTEAARKEWGFEGIFMTDWMTTNMEHGSSAVKCIQAGNDLIMPGNLSDLREIMDGLEEKGDLSLKEEALDACVRRMLRIILKSDVYENAVPYGRDIVKDTFLKAE